MIAAWLRAWASRGPAHSTAPALRLDRVLALDARRRLSLVRVGGRHVLLLTGGAQDQVVGWLPEVANEQPGNGQPANGQPE